MIDEHAYRHALTMNKGKTFSIDGDADECFRYFINCYEAAKASEQSENDCKAAFERWGENEFSTYFNIMDNGHYANAFVDIAWQAWKEAWNQKGRKRDLVK